MAIFWGKKLKLRMCLMGAYTCPTSSCPSQCCRNVQNSTIFRKLGNGFLSTPKVFWALLWAFRHLGSPFWPFLIIFRPPEASGKPRRQAPKCSFEASTGGKKVQKLVFWLLDKNDVWGKASLLEHFWCLEMLRKGPEHVQTPTGHKYVHPKAQQIEAKIPVPLVLTVKGKKNWKFQNFQTCTYVCIYLLWGGKCSVMMF